MTHAEYMIELEKLYLKALSENDIRLAFDIAVERRTQAIQSEDIGGKPKPDKMEKL